ncbi:alpha/beta hydrolase [Paractinoplanes abujensis]|uniref:Putative alpha/beta hydrolase family esterase/SAM-dependent methyltransferase n=1 Tax=Paractinoplanes abujensis TaxID=882441 RepID=A0A7W7G2C7_9ACTN|nr:alpha/beta hydrolase [Actinoplanes abujensis]MBB4693637.1 putative alpha/beta hydrolase family esterase/SAM-dependent methyltransferase [Actinoplanes abujensis]
MTRFLVVPGRGVPSADHWSRAWVDGYPEFSWAPEPPGPPVDVAGRVAALHAAISADDEPAVLVAHGAGCLIVAAWAAAHAGPVSAALLVTPPWAPDGADGPRRRLPFRSILVASRDDPMATFEQFRAYAEDWGSELVDAGPAGHLDSKSGSGPWPAGERLARSLSGPVPRNPAQVFGEVPGEYDRVRPAYPLTLVDDVLSYGPSGPGGRRALEVGAGTGRATVPFAAAGMPIVVVEPDDAMADVLERRVSSLAGVDVVRDSFEGFRSDEKFGLLFSAEAWHWTRPGTRWSQAADLLADGATLALFWNTERIAEPGLRTSMLEVLARHAPAVVVNDEAVTADQVWHRWPGDELSQLAGFEGRTSRHYLSRRSVAARDYLGLTRTRSQFRMLPPPVRRDVLAGLTQLFADEVPLEVHTTLLLARRSLRGPDLQGGRRAEESAGERH